VKSTNEESGGGARFRRKKNAGRLISRLKFLLSAALVTAAFILLALSPLFNIRSIQVNGNRHYKAEEIIDISGVITGANGFKTIGSSVPDLFRLRYGKAEEALVKNCPYIKNATVRYVIPSNIVINIVEREPFMVVPYLGTNLVTDEEGVVLDTAENADKSGLPCVKGLTFGQFNLGQALKTDDPEVLRTSIRVISAIRDSDGENGFNFLRLVKYIDASNTNGIFLFVDSRLTVNLGDMQDLNYKISFLKQIYAKNLKKSDRGYLDFTNRKSPSFVPEEKKP